MLSSGAILQREISEKYISVLRKTPFDPDELSRVEQEFHPSIGMSQKISSAAKNLKPGDSVTVFILTHGSPSNGQPFEANSLNNAGIGLQYRSLKHILKNTIPDTIPVRIVNGACYGGGVHETTYDRKNICAVSLTNATTFAYDTVGAHSLSYLFKKGNSIQVQPRGYFNRFLKFQETSPEKKWNLANFFQADQGIDFRNAAFQRISSLSYIESFLKEGDYANLPPADSSKASWIRHLMGSIDSALFGNPAIRRRLTVNRKYMDDRANPCKFRTEGNNLNEQLGALTKLESDFENVMDFIAKTDDSNLPKELKATFRNTFDRWKINKDQYLDTVQKYQERFAQLEDEWQNLRGDTPEFESLFQARFDELERNARKDLSEFFEVMAMRDYLDKVSRFLRAASTEQKEHLLNLIACENGEI